MDKTEDGQEIKTRVDIGSKKKTKGRRKGRQEKESENTPPIGEEFHDPDIFGAKDELVEVSCCQLHDIILPMIVQRLRGRETQEKG